MAREIDLSDVKPDPVAVKRLEVRRDNGSKEDDS